MAVTAASIKARWASDFGSLTDDAVSAAITEAELFVDSEQFGDKYDLATQLLAAHILKLDAQGGDAPAGPMTSVKLLEFAASFAAPAGVDMNLAATSYGRRYQAVANTIEPDRTY